MDTLVRIKGMVCPRCISAVKSAFLNHGFVVTGIELGEVTYRSSPDPQPLDSLRQQLTEEGYEMLDSQQTVLLTRLKALVDEWIHTYAQHAVNFAPYISEALPANYNSISTLFSQTQGYTLEQYMIRRRVALVQRRLADAGLPLADIAYELGYSSIHHLSNQFKKEVGLTPSGYRTLLLQQPSAAAETAPASE